MWTVEVGLISSEVSKSTSAKVNSHINRRDSVDHQSFYLCGILLVVKQIKMLTLKKLLNKPKVTYAESWASYVRWCRIDSLVLSK